MSVEIGQHDTVFETGSDSGPSDDTDRLPAVQQSARHIAADQAGAEDAMTACLFKQAT